MRSAETQRGFTMIEALVSLTVLALAMSGLFSLLVHNSRLNKSEQMKAETQANARNVLSIVVQKLRSAGWDPLGTDLFNGITLDTNTGDTIAEVTVRADYHTAGTPNTPDGSADQIDEVIVFRHTNNTLIWDRDDDGSFEVLAVNISNDADGDGTIENMFVPDSTIDPQQITVQITARSPVIDPVTRDFTRYTVTSDVFIQEGSMIHSERTEQRTEQGSALVMAVFVLALLTAMGAALLFFSTNETKMAEASIKPKKAFYYAEAGLEHARRALWMVNRAEDFDDDLEFATGRILGDPTFDPTTDPIGFDPATISPVYDSFNNLVGFSGYDNDTPLVAIRQLDDGWYGAFMSNDHTEGRTNAVDTDNRVILAGVGVGPDQSFEVVEAVIDLDPFLPEMPPATIFLLGPTPEFHTGSSKKKTFAGNDCGVSGGDYYPVVGTIGSAAEASAEAGAHTNPTYETGAYTTPGDVISDMTASPVAGMSDAGYTMDSQWTSCQAMKDLVEGMRNVADVTCGDATALASPSCPADVSNPKRIYFGDGDLDVMRNIHHYGVLVVTGVLTLGGNVDFDGVIMAIGEGSFRYNGAGTGRVMGSLIIANIAGPDGIYGNADDCTGGDAGFGVSVYDERGGGNAGNVYCSTVLDISEQANPYEILQFRQH